MPQHVEDPVGGRSPDHKLLVPVPLVGREACKDGPSFSTATAPPGMAQGYLQDGWEAKPQRSQHPEDPGAGKAQGRGCLGPCVQPAVGAEVLAAHTVLTPEPDTTEMGTHRACPRSGAARGRVPALARDILRYFSLVGVPSLAPAVAMAKAEAADRALRVLSSSRQDGITTPLL